MRIAVAGLTGIASRRKDQTSADLMNMEDMRMAKRVIVVGAGNAALVAALAASDAGAKVTVLEKAPRDQRGGNTRYTAGLVRFAFDELSAVDDLLGSNAATSGLATVEPYTAETFTNAIMHTSRGEADPDLTDWLVSESQDVLGWMKDHGIDFEFAQYLTTAEGGKAVYRNGLVLQSAGGGEGLTAMEFAAVERAGCEIRYGTAAIDLIKDDIGGVVGVRVRNDSGNTEDLYGEVILGCGGFEANPEMRTRYLGPEWNLVKVRGVPYNTGELLDAALRAGAATYGHWADCHAAPIDSNSPKQGTLDTGERTNRTSFLFGIAVNERCERFIDEGRDWAPQNYVAVGKTVLKQPNGIGYQLFDQKVAELLDPRYDDATVYQADTLEGLAEKAGLDPEKFVRTVTEYNSAVDDATVFDSTIKDGKATRGLEPPKSNWAQRIDAPPFRLYPFTGGITFTFGGLRIDRNGRVLDAGTGTPIPGLYAIGEMTGGFFYHSYPAGSGLVCGSITGRAAGAAAAVAARREATAVAAG
ncbi:FAD-dependent tricarballylate dehydrogenase TcuA [Mycolicibacterium septicum]|uniref:FAD-dependent tricarballylate dehydrogenase TcuA n=1 Tax=Mycolicibacterium septicum TaxID=98668 RepID=UPI0023E1DDD7|nr:FAD-dependent tricarballylate dehydrogenase TcuA [Mycolicibacterium septicum]MDF3340551.1 FAD-dependent tricarballylate dehydrogenase TcuA [Mycolicibacterium septicum]